MKVAVTGAAGKLGREVCRELHAAGHEVLGLDTHVPPDPDHAMQMVDVLDPVTTIAALAGMETVVHLANHPTHQNRPPQTVFNENCAMNLNVCEAARSGGARRIIFASSIHACTGGRRPEQANAPSEIPYLPLDGDMPPHCDEVYGLSKISGEQILRFYARHHGLTTIALRFSRLSPTPPPAEGWPVEKHPWLDEAFTWLTFADAARCITAAAITPLGGYHCYLPASPRPWAGAPAEALRQKYYPAVVLKSPAPLLSLVDQTALARDLNWSPQD